MIQRCKGVVRSATDSTAMDAASKTQFALLRLVIVASMAAGHLRSRHHTGQDHTVRQPDIGEGALVVESAGAGLVPTWPV